MHIQDNFVNSNSESDKVPRHGYQRFYPYFLEPFRGKENVKVLEIGFHLGNSVQLWNRYLLKPRIFSIDIKDSVECDLLERYYKVDQSDNEQLEKFVKGVNDKFEIIIDDGSHVPDHQWNTFLRLFAILEKGGIYIIEDIETSFWGKSIVYGYPFDSNHSSLIKKIKMISDIINAEFNEVDLKKRYQLTDTEYDCLKQIELCTIGHNCLIFVKKDYARNQSYYRSFAEYPMKGNINARRSKWYKRIVGSNIFKRLFQ